jgi:hypothetical protein
VDADFAHLAAIPRCFTSSRASRPRSSTSPPSQRPSPSTEATSPFQRSVRPFFCCLLPPPRTLSSLALSTRRSESLASRLTLSLPLNLSRQQLTLTVPSQILPPTPRPATFTSPPSPTVSRPPLSAVSLSPPSPHPSPTPAPSSATRYFGSSSFKACSSALERLLRSC